MDSAAVVGTLLDAMPADLHGVVSYYFVAILHQVITKPFNAADVKWLIQMQKYITVFYADDKKCEIQPWKQTDEVVYLGHFRETYEVSSVKSTHIHRNFNASTYTACDRSWLIDWVMDRKLVDGRNVHPIPGILDIRSYFLLTKKRATKLGMPTLAKEVTLEFLVSTIQSLRAYPIALEIYLRESTNAFRLCLKVSCIHQGSMVVCSDDEIRTRCEVFHTALVERMGREN